MSIWPGLMRLLKRSMPPDLISLPLKSSCLEPSRLGGMHPGALAEFSGLICRFETNLSEIPALKLSKYKWCYLFFRCLMHGNAGPRRTCSSFSVLILNLLLMEATWGMQIWTITTHCNNFLIVIYFINKSHGVCC